MFPSLSDFRRRLLNWYDRHRRALPWRLPAGVSHSLDPYHVLVSELMLQQTQVATVIPYFHRFLEKFPTLASLAASEEQEVLRLWQGLGYYSRARNLRQAACRVVSEYGGTLPSDPGELLKLPGIGRYTAGAVASLAFGRRAPILDGNVARVLCRLDCIETDPRDRQTQARLWQRAEEVLPRQRVGDFNSALMELGATVCTPRSPSCLLCPVRGHCEAFAAGMQEKIPAPRKAAATPMLERWIFAIHREGAAGREWLIEQRPPRGRWAGMWQFITLEAGDGSPEAAVRGLLSGVRMSPPKPVGVVTHALTHRRYTFDVFVCSAGNAGMRPETPQQRRWVTRSELDAYPLPRPHVKAARLAGV